MAALLVAFLGLAAGVSAQLNVAFNHGVASGDPLHDGIIIWTRITPRVAQHVQSMSDEDSRVDPDSHIATYTAEYAAYSAMYNVTWMVSEHADLHNPVQHGVYTTSSKRDFTVKVDVPGLTPLVQYYYGFQIDGAESPVGKFRLQPKEGVKLDKLRYGVYTCSNWGWGYFNAYDYGAQLDLDFWMHMGDYIYEYGPNVYPSSSEAVRYAPFPGGIQPPHEMVSLSDYRGRYAHYRTDPGLQALHASAPLIAIWDDHEHTNDPYRDGAQNHSPDEGDWEQRKEWSVRAYHEWMPIRSGGEFGEPGYIGAKIWRSFTMGDLAKIVALENRLLDRTRQYPDGMPSIGGEIADIVGETTLDELTEEQIAALQDVLEKANAVRSDPDRKIIDDEQLEFLRTEAAGDETWTVVAQTTNVHNVISDYEKAVEVAKEHVPEIGSLWEAALHNVTREGREIQSYSTSPHMLHKLGEKYNSTLSTAIGWTRRIVTGRYGIITWFDPWGAHIVNREQFLDALREADGNAIVYSGDTHAAYGAMLRTMNGEYVGAEYSSPGVSSPSSERGSEVPLELHNAAQLTGANAWMDTRYKGFQLVTLTHDKHHVDFITNGWGSPDYKVSCDYAFDLASACGAGASNRKLMTSEAPAKGSKFGLPVDVVEDLLNPAGKDQSRPAMKVVACSDIPEAVPYAMSSHGVSHTTGPADLSKHINTIDVY